MPKSQKLEEILSILAQIREHPTSEEGMRILRQGLKSKYSIAVAQAAKIVGESTITELVSELIRLVNKEPINREFKNGVLLLFTQNH